MATTFGSGLGFIFGPKTAAMLEDLLDQAMVNQIKTMLSDGQDSLPDAKPTRTVDSWFGAGDGGRQMALHAGKANEKVREAIGEMVESLSAFYEGVELTQAEMGQAEDNTAATMRQIEHGTAYAGDGSFHDNGLSAPNGSGDS